MVKYIVIGLHDYNIISQRQCLVFIILPRLEDIQEYVHYWNSYLMRHNRLADCPSGVPNELFELPSLHSKTYMVLQLHPSYRRFYYYYDRSDGLSCSIWSLTDPSLWMHAWLDESSTPKEFFSNRSCGSSYYQLLVIATACMQDDLHRLDR